jgi:hypothetical protein
MRQTTVLRRVCGVWLAALLALPLAAIGDGDALPFSKLSIAEPQRHFSATQACVEPEEEMRRNHMEYILHQRDETMHRGIRTRQYALEECINCHATKDDSGNYVRVEDSQHFCASCHTYASVSIDCFQCHSDVPVRASGLNGQQSGTDLTRETLRFLASEGKSQ